MNLKICPGAFCEKPACISDPLAGLAVKCGKIRVNTYYLKNTWYLEGWSNVYTVVCEGVEVIS